jgi:hypothetical protein
VARRSGIGLSGFAVWSMTLPADFRRRFRRRCVRLYGMLCWTG